jgi:hypothetical protein
VLVRSFQAGLGDDVTLHALGACSWPSPRCYRVPYGAAQGPDGRDWRRTRVEPLPRLPGLALPSPLNPSDRFCPVPLVAGRCFGRPLPVGRPPDSTLIRGLPIALPGRTPVAFLVTMARNL